MTVAFIERDGQLFALVPAEVYERMLDDLDDLDDVRLYDAAKGKLQEYVPAAVVDRLIAGENPVAVWREHRGLSAVALAKAVEISPPYLSQIEHGRRQPSLDVLRRLAQALGVDIDDLVTGDR
jgi:DNA-binding XRE family transcriptional regulator